MQFGKVYYFWLLGLVPLLILFYGGMLRQRRLALERFAGQDLAQKLLTATSPFKQKAKVFLVIFSFVFLALALTEPKWGFHIEEIKRQGVDIVIALDVSKSMLAQDVKPSRLLRAKLEIESLFDRLPGDRVALVAFSGTSFIQCPLTLDYATAKLFLDDLGIHSIPRGGTDIGGAIHKSLEAFEGHEGGDKVILLLTDGEDHGTQLEEALRVAKEQNVAVFPVGVGKSEGAPIPMVDEEGTARYHRNHEGEIVLSKLDPRLLQRIAETTGGKGGIIGSGDFSLEDLYEREIGKLEKTELASQQRKEYHHRFQWPLALAFFFLTMEGLLSERK